MNVWRGGRSYRAGQADVVEGQIPRAFIIGKFELCRSGRNGEGPHSGADGGDTADRGDGVPARGIEFLDEQATGGVRRQALHPEGKLFGGTDAENPGGGRIQVLIEPERRRGVAEVSGRGIGIGILVAAVEGPAARPGPGIVPVETFVDDIVGRRRGRGRRRRSRGSGGRGGGGRGGGWGGCYAGDDDIVESQVPRAFGVGKTQLGGGGVKVEGSYGGLI